METVLAGLSWKICLIYPDGIIVVSRKLEGMLENLSQVFERLLSAGQQMLLISQVSWISRSCHIFRRSNYRSEKKEIEAIWNISVPVNVGDLCSFPGICSYYSKFVRDFDEIAKPLHRFTEKNNSFVWNDKCQAAFEKLKHSLTSAPFLAHPD